MIEAKLTWTVKCDSCLEEFYETYHSDWFSGWTCGKLSEEELSGDDIIESARMKGWDFHRRSYEELVPYCPKCKDK